MEPDSISQNESLPIFNNKLSELTPDMLEDWLFVLGQANNEDMKNTSVPVGCHGHFKSDCYFSLIASICNELEQPREVRYPAAEIFDTFMVKHVEALRAHVTSNSADPQQRIDEWQVILQRVRGQLVLRMYSCVQIASKLNLHHKAAVISKIEKCLSRTEKSYGPRSILKSELRVLDTLDYRLDLRHPLMFVEALLDILERNDDSVGAKDLYPVALDVLDAFYMQRDHVFEQLFRRLTGKLDMDAGDRVQLDVVTKDSMFVGTSVIACSVYVIDHSHFEKSVEHLQAITRIPVDEIMDLALVLITMILHHEESA